MCEWPQFLSHANRIPRFFPNFYFYFYYQTHAGNSYRQDLSFWFSQWGVFLHLSLVTRISASPLLFRMPFFFFNPCRQFIGRIARFGSCTDAFCLLLSSCHTLIRFSTSFLNVRDFLLNSCRQFAGRISHYGSCS